MIGKFIGEFDKCVTDDNGFVIVSFAVRGADRLNARQCATRIKEQFASGKNRLTIEVDTYRKQRSLNANAYFHVLVGKIAQAQKIGADECKRELVLSYGTVARDGCGEMVGIKLPTTVNVFDFYPYAKWFDKRTENGKEFNCYIFYKQTHLLDKAEMARLVEGAIYEAEQLDIETKTPDEIAQMMSLWECK
ncbi:MAG: hypothetical protein RR348_01505 [Clostridia bacterium]